MDPLSSDFENQYLRKKLSTIELTTFLLIKESFEIWGSLFTEPSNLQTTQEFCVVEEAY